MSYTRDNVLTLEDFAKLDSGTVWGAIDEAYNAGTNPFRATGVSTVSPLIAGSLADGENIRTEVQAWNDIEYVESNISNDDPEDHATPLKMESKLWGAVRGHRNVGVSGMNLVQDFTAKDPVAALAERVANYQNTDEVTQYFAVLDGLIAGDATAKKFTYEMDTAFDIKQVIRALQAKKGDNAGIIKSLGLSSANYLELKLLNLVDRNNTDTKTSFGQVADLNLIVDDRFGTRIVGLGDGLFHSGSAPQSRKSVEVESDASAGNGSGQETIWFRWKNIIHPMGFDYTGTFVAKGGPSFTELKAASAYTVATDPKKIPLVVLKPTV